jgi:NADH dehydrogenase FAD-containing subunit
VLFYLDTGISEEEKKRLLHCVVVGGGPTGVEFSGELSDFIMKDVRQRYTHVKDYIRVTLIEVCSIAHQIQSNTNLWKPFFVLENYHFSMSKMSLTLF